MALDVSVIFVNYKTLAVLVPAIDSVLEKSEGFSYEVIVVDNHSEDDSERILKERYGERVTYLSLSENVGFGRANNEGIRKAHGRNILFLNPDTLLINNAIKILCDYLDVHPSVGAVGGNLYSLDMKPNFSFSRILPSIFTETDQATFRMLSRLRFGRNSIFNYTQHPIEVGFVSGANIMIPFKVLADVGNFDPDFFMYYEETELCSRIRKSGRKIVNVPSARIIHLEGKSFVNNIGRERRSLVSRRLYYSKTHSIGYACLANINYRMWINIALFYYGIRSDKANIEKFRQRKMLFDEINTSAS